MKYYIIIIICVAINVGCASQIMKGYIGKDVREVMLDYGPPSNAFDMGDGRRAFQWVKNSSYTTPIHEKTTETSTTIGYQTWVNSNTTIRGGQTINSSCIYTLFATWAEERQGWIVKGFKKPNLMCE